MQDKHFILELQLTILTLAYLHLLKFRFGTLHFVCGLFALINRVDICVARTETLSFLKYGEVILLPYPYQAINCHFKVAKKGAFGNRMTC